MARLTRLTAVLGLVVVAIGCAPAATTPETARATAAAPARTVRPVVPTPTPAASCQAYEPLAPDPAAVAELGPSAGLPPSPAAPEGERFVLRGVLLSRTCDVRAHTGLDAWHTDPKAHYGPPTTDGSLRCCYYHGTVTTDSEGRFELRTIRPATDPDPNGELPAHVHVALEGASGSNIDIGLVFADDPDHGPLGPRQLLLEMERRTDAEGAYWFSFVVIRI